jgi:5-oxoprolinase (ATP-hydrolysing) subunit A
LSDVAREFDINIAFLKPHGALYTQAQRDLNVASPIVHAAHSLKLPLLGQPGGVLEAEAHAQRVPYVPEGVPDRRYQDDGSLVPRSQLDAVLKSAAEIELRCCD